MGFVQMQGFHYHHEEDSSFTKLVPDDISEFCELEVLAYLLVFLDKTPEAKYFSKIFLCSGTLARSSKVALALTLARSSTILYLESRSVEVED